jgi:hypothetical protein
MAPSTGLSSSPPRSSGRRLCRRRGAVACEETLLSPSVVPISTAAAAASRPPPASVESGAAGHSRLRAGGSRTHFAGTRRSIGLCRMSAGSLATNTQTTTHKNRKMVEPRMGGGKMRRGSGPGESRLATTIYSVFKTSFWSKVQWLFTRDCFWDLVFCIILTKT